MSIAPFVVVVLLLAFWGWRWFRNPEKTFPWLVFILPTYVIRFHIGPIPTTALELFILTAIAARLAAGFASIKQSDHPAAVIPRLLNWCKKYPAVILWLVAGLVGVFAASDHLSALGLYRAYILEPVLIFAVGANLFYRADAKKRRELATNVMQVLAIGAILLGAWAVVQYLTGWGIPAPWNAVGERRATGPFPYPNALALFVVPIGALLFADAIRKQPMLPRAISIPAILAVGVATVFAQSEGGIIALATAMVAALVIQKRSRLIGIILLAVGVAGIFLAAPLRDRIADILSQRDWSTKVRVVMWKESVAMLKDRPIFGAGLGGYPVAIAPYHKATWMEIFQYPHNIVLNLWSETGLLGLLAFGWIIWSWGRKKGEDAHLATWPVILAILIHGLVDVPYFKNDLAILFWMLVLITTYEKNNTH